MLTDQDLRKRVQTDSQILARLASLERTLALVHGGVLQLVSATPKQDVNNESLNRLISAAAMAMNRPGYAVTWSVAELQGRCLGSDAQAQQLTSAIRALPCTHTTKGVGKYLASRVSEKYTTPEGLTLWREYSAGDGNNWSIKGFETGKGRPALF